MVHSMFLLAPIGSPARFQLYICEAASGYCSATVVQSGEHAILFKSSASSARKGCGQREYG
jgi:hypothetical protein